jgi:hypothetical protein
MEKLRAVAAAKLQLEPLQWWWSKKYNRPLKDPILDSYTIEELQIEHLMELIEEDPQQAYPRGDMGSIQFRTGDPIIDDWEKQLAEGKDPSKINWDTGVDPEFLERFKKYSKRVAERMDPALAEARLRETADVQLPPPERDEFLDSLVGFSDDYTR